MPKCYGGKTQSIPQDDAGWKEQARIAAEAPSLPSEQGGVCKGHRTPTIILRGSTAEVEKTKDTEPQPQVRKGPHRTLAQPFSRSLWDARRTQKRNIEPKSTARQGLWGTILRAGSQSPPTVPEQRECQRGSTRPKSGLSTNESFP